MKIDRCRICSCTDLKVCLDLGEMSPCGVFPRTIEEDPAPQPLCVVRCTDCGLVQLLHTLDPAVTFNPEGFGYRSATNLEMRKHLESLSKRLYGLADFSPGDTVVDIGSNDGLFLSRLPHSLNRIGVDPVAIKYFQNGLYDGCDFYAQFFDDYVAEQIEMQGGAKAITCFACLYDIPDPNAFMANIKRALKPDGVFFCEVAYLPSLMDSGGFDVISHEHLLFFHIQPLRRLLEQHGFWLDRLESNAVNGGSVQFVARPNPSTKRERAVTEADWDRFRKGVERAKLDSLGFFARASLEGKTVHGYAASTRGNTLLQHFRIGPDDISCIADANPDKVGCITPRTRIPIVSEEQSRSRNPDYYYCLSWHFIDGFVQREREFLERGGKFVVPLPEFRIIGAEALA